jgi:hypothetical protein
MFYLSGESESSGEAAHYGQVVPQSPEELVNRVSESKEIIEGLYGALMEKSVNDDNKKFKESVAKREVQALKESIDRIQSLIISGAITADGAKAALQVLKGRAFAIRVEFADVLSVDDMSKMSDEIAHLTADIGNSDDLFFAAESTQFSFLQGVRELQERSKPASPDIWMLGICIGSLRNDREFEDKYTQLSEFYYSDKEKGSEGQHIGRVRLTAVDLKKGAVEDAKDFVKKFDESAEGRVINDVCKAMGRERRQAIDKIIAEEEADKQRPKRDKKGGSLKFDPNRAQKALETVRAERANMGITEAEVQAVRMKNVRDIAGTMAGRHGFLGDIQSAAKKMKDKIAPKSKHKEVEKLESSIEEGGMLRASALLSSQLREQNEGLAEARKIGITGMGRVSSVSKHTGTIKQAGPVPGPKSRGR